jgi:hypothetical protein
MATAAKVPTEIRVLSRWPRAVHVHSREDDSAEIKAILKAFGDARQATEVAKADVLSWMNSTDIQVQGAISQILLDHPERTRAIRPPLDREDYELFLRSYLARCIREDPDGEWPHPRYVAGHAVVAWMLGHWRRGELEPRDVEVWKSWIRDLYLMGDEKVRDAVVNGILEHLFEERAMRKLFADWREHPELRVAYELACEWGG